VASATYADEASLVRALRAGESTAYELLVRSHAPSLLAVARRFLRDEGDAQDAVQEAFLAGFKSITSFEEGCRVSTWPVASW
jgi:RNA polymerase sigma-70 factor, ECF subfamily